ncbi:TOTE conflict system archaeo-eukaryotic primase domain-containing protein [Paenibacillus sp. Leaf72]|uniref:TOTE conflict system archaeo-eukaryotic primase domain-containing protein n=1 Tax=Paenibacillus sp. Leaf72 TaxID=1736234 RepID=UPI0006F81870|nr:hypothetical protein [Paenibacillus sp. Leaf72]KQN97595.1 hypothetical protein ASF12_20495 [Paenibacillus sp. Leaf72]
MQRVIDRLFDLYLIQNHHYLIQMTDGSYITRNDTRRPLRLHHLLGHLNGKRPIGTFAGAYLTKFICFDVDYRDPAVAKWVTYKLAHTLSEAGLHNYAISYSGGKGYHVELFFDKAISLESSRQVFSLIISRAELVGVEGGEVEFRPSSMQGVKLPLSIHQKTAAFCGFCEIGDGLRVMERDESIAYFLTLKKTAHADVLALIAEDRAYENREAADMEDAVGRHKPLATYDQSESYTLAHAANRFNEGMKGPGQRHNSFLLLARLMNHNGVERPDALSAITEWFAWQDARLYTSDWTYCMRDLRECVDYVYDNDKTLLTEQNRDLTVSFNEIDTIIRSCSGKAQKALTYAMLIHSKRWANESGVFYMTSAQMGEAAGIDARTARRKINELEKIGVIAIISRNQAQKGTFKKKPNLYRMNLGGESLDKRSFEAGSGDFNACIRHFYTEQEIRRLLPRRQGVALLTEYRASLVNK